MGAKLFGEHAWFFSCFDLGARILQERPRKGRAFSTLAAIRSLRYECYCLWPHLGLFKVGNRVRRHAKTNPGNIKGPSQYKPLHRQRQFCHVDRSLLARRRATFGTSTASFGMATDRYYFTIYYFPVRRPSNTASNRISPTFPFSILFLSTFNRNLKLSLSFNTNLRRNLVLASPRPLLARGRVTFGMSTVHFWPVDGCFGMSTGRIHKSIVRK